MTSEQWMEAARLALEILKQNREALITTEQARILLDGFGFGGLIPK